jgi:hypothetical protein
VPWVTLQMIKAPKTIFQLQVFDPDRHQRTETHSPYQAWSSYIVVELRGRLA